MSDSSDPVNPSFPLSEIGKALGQHTGIGELMDDLGRALAEKPADLCMLGGGQPAKVPEMISLIQSRLKELSADAETVHQVLGEYDPVEGNLQFRTAVAEMFHQLYGWELTAENIGVAAGSQSACFHLMNALVGEGEHLMIPLLPDYMGYRDQLITGGTFYGVEGLIQREGTRFKYTVDEAAVRAAPESIKLMAVSRPTNPSGNVLSDAEISFLSAECERRGIPLIIDHAYGDPFPSALYVPTAPFWKPHHIHLYSFSKLGLPGCRTSIAIAAPSLIKLMANMTAVTSLANPNLGQALLTPLITDSTLPTHSRDILTPFYKGKRGHALTVIKREFTGIDYTLHAPEGAFFLWLWLPGLKRTSVELVTELKKNGVLVISGHWFFYGKENLSPHTTQCLRLTYSMPKKEVEGGIKKMAAVLRKQ